VKLSSLHWTAEEIRKASSFCLETARGHQDDETVLSVLQAAIASTAELLHALRLKDDESVMKDILEHCHQSCITSDIALVTARLLNNCSLLLPVPSLGLISYSGSHVCTMDKSTFHTSIDCFHIHHEFFLQRRKLACSNEFVGGPACIFGRKDSGSTEYLLSITVEEFAYLWGPLQAYEVYGPSGTCDMVSERKEVCCIKLRRTQKRIT